ncbi:uroporphyrinogen-III C-methyltransferase [Aquincola tertiaricarbonis]|uniref:Uroporphyrinogen-III C-methyltransferase n=1 Tax=Aquincola tertiaricarbonis TaxID=391953 RepID=A0ABY4S4Q1_AQUTE|nr:uroporphyrinogen-III C-methyltransferase [Aquincola tertiaricarbonis]URI07969.1 uroporphyrinogen-III C-methyltransferase [Aquincola tertiaricarbonis]
MPRWLGLLALVLAVVSIAALTLAWDTQRRVRSFEQELVKRQQDSQSQSSEARMLARQSQDASREAAAKVALLEARLSEVALQRSQVEELMQALSRSRDENVVADMEAAVRVALQQSAITGSAEPLVATLSQIDERLARYNQPRLERVRRAVARDLERVKAIGVADVASLSIRLDEAVRLVDELPLLAVAEPRRVGSEAAQRRAAARAAAASPAAGASAPDASWRDQALDLWERSLAAVWGEVRSLVRVTRIDSPDAVLAAPDQVFFIRENLKLRLLNARLALLSRQFDSAQADLRDAQATLDRYFDRNAKRVQSASELLRQVMSQARQTGVPRPDDTLAALAAVAAGR